MQVWPIQFQYAIIREIYPSGCLLTPFTSFYCKMIIVKEDKMLGLQMCHHDLIGLTSLDGASALVCKLVITDFSTCHGPTTRITK